MPDLRFDFEAIGTAWSVDIYDPPARLSEKEILTAIKNRIEKFDKNYSRFRADSWVSQLSKNPGTYSLPEDAKPLFELYESLYQLTDGLVTPLVGTALEEAGYDSAYSLEINKLSRVPTWQEALEINGNTLKLKLPRVLDFGAAGKGYLIDIVGELLESFGLADFCIDAGGDILHKKQSNEILRVGLENPQDKSQAIGVAKIKNFSICGSAGNRRKWKSFHHILNPKTLKPQDEILATWAVAKTAMLADGLATCLFFSNPAKLLAAYEFEYLVLYPDMSIKKSEKFPAELFIKS